MMPVEMKQENELLRAQLVQCTTAMRNAALELRAYATDCSDRWDTLAVIASELEVARAKPVAVPPNAFAAYQAETRRTTNGDPLNVLIFALGLCGEAGEVAELIKKYLGHGVPFELDKLKKELGDVLWYLSRLADEHGLALQDVADSNVAKLRARYPDGFTTGGGKRVGEAA